MNRAFIAVILTTLITVGPIVLPTDARAIAISPWPSADAVGTDITSGILAVDPSFEPSGIAWHEDRSTFFVVDDGHNIAEIQPDGTLVNLWDGGYNFEGIAVPNNAGTVLYVADENNSVIRGFDVSTGTMNGQAWDVSALIYPVGALGLEALEFVPDGVHGFGTGTYLGGVFYAGWQYDGNVRVIEPTSDNAFIDHGTIVTSPDFTDLSGLDYNAAANVLFAIFDANDALQEYAPTGGDETAEYYVPASAQEGIAVVADCATNTATVTIADDGGRVITYQGYPIVCAAVDADGDGVLSSSDCDDADPSISSPVTYYADADGDGYGSASQSTSACSLAAPVGYVENDDDLYDSARIEISGDGVDNDGDALADERNTLAENGVHPLYGAQDPKTTTDVIFYAMRSGALFVTYRDQSQFRYAVFPQGTSQCGVSSVSATYYALAMCDGKYAIVNTLNGTLVARSKFSRRADAIAWAAAIVAPL